MNIAEVFARWWDRLRGHEPARVKPAARQQTRAPAGGAASDSGQRSKAAPTGSKDGGLELLDETKPGEPRKRKPGAAGFDPYSSDAGYQKPHGWERVDRD